MDIEREIRSVLNDDEPAPPPPPEPRGDDGRGDRGPHIRICMPLLIVHEDGAIATGDWRGSWLVAWHHLSSAVTLAVAAYLLLLYRDSLLVPALFLMACGMALAFACAVVVASAAAFRAGWRWGRGRRAGRAVQP